MTDRTAFDHRHDPRGIESIRRKLSSADDIRTRAARIVDFMALSGDTRLIDRHIASVAEILGDYAELDQRARGR